MNGPELFFLAGVCLCAFGRPGAGVILLVIGIAIPI
jgi:hypothetical protein